MLFDIAAWALVIAVGYTVGVGVLGALGADQLRSGDRFTLATWIGIVILALTLLGASLVAPLSPWVGLGVAGSLAAVGALAAARTRPHGRRPRGAAARRYPPAPVVVGVLLIATGAAALGSDPVTLYDSLVYHVGIMRWLREHGTVPGIVLIHNRLAHVSAWFALGAPFDAGPAAQRAAAIPMGLALVMVGIQGAIGVARIAARNASGADWFLALSAAALIWTVPAYNTATPSPDVAANALILIVAWSMLVVPRASLPGRRRRLTGRLIPFVLAVGATAMKLFALPAAVASAVFYALAATDDRGTRGAAVRLGVCAAVGVVLLAPFVAANLVASGCPLFPSPVGCVHAPWSVGAAQAADYAEYIRDVARWESRRSMSGATQLPWIGTWIAAHPVLTTLAVLAPVLALVLLRGPRRDGVRSVVLTAILGLAFAGWQAPAPRFLYAFVVMVPIVAVAYRLAGALRRTAGPETPSGGAPGLASGAPSAPGAEPPFAAPSISPTVGTDVRRRAAGGGFLTGALAVSLVYAVASQKVNIRSAVLSGAAAVPALGAEWLVPAAPEAPARLYRWRVNDLDVVTPVPRPIADTLGYHSAIDGDVGFEKCSTAPLPCTPYLPGADVWLRSPGRGVASGFVRKPSGPELSFRRARCVGELSAPFGGPLLSRAEGSPVAEAPARCGEVDAR